MYYLGKSTTPVEHNPERENGGDGVVDDEGYGYSTPEHLIRLRSRFLAEASYTTLIFQGSNHVAVIKLNRRSNMSYICAGDLLSRFISYMLI